MTHYPCDMNIRVSVISALFVILITSCGTPSNITDVPYFQNSRDVTLSQSPVTNDLLIRPKDALNIFVHSRDDNASAQLNRVEQKALSAGVRSTYDYGTLYKYLVENNGEIDYPLIGKVKVVGLTIEQAAQLIQKRLTPFFSEDPALTVNVRIANFYVSVLGEVRNPQTFDVTRPRLTVLEALAKAGDLTAYGKRDNVKLLRQQDNGEYEIHELDLRDANILNSPYYYLQQRDIVYVEPNEVAAQETKVGQTTRLWVRGALITVSLGSLLYRVLQ